MKRDSTNNEIRKGLLVLAVLQLLKNKRLYTAELLERLSSTEFTTQEGTLYPLLSRLKREGLIDHDWVESSSGPPRKYYRLSDKGQKYCESLLKYMETLHDQLLALNGEETETK